MKKLFILLGLLMFSILGCSCERIKVPEETRVLGGCVYVEKKNLESAVNQKCLLTIMWDSYLIRKNMMQMKC